MTNYFHIAQLSQIQDLLIEWQRDWSSICIGGSHSLWEYRSAEIAKLASLTAAWSEWVLDKSGLLVAASMTA